MKGSTVAKIYLERKKPLNHQYGSTLSAYQAQSRQAKIGTNPNLLRLLVTIPSRPLWSGQLSANRTWLARQGGQQGDLQMRSATLPHELKVQIGGLTHPEIRKLLRPRELHQAFVARLKDLRDSFRLPIPDAPLDGNIFRWTD